MRKVVAIAAMACAAMACQLTPSSSQLLAVENRERAPRQADKRKEKQQQFAYGSTRWKRSRGPQAKPKKHRNRLTISKRVRAKHRRAA